MATTMPDLWDRLARAALRVLPRPRAFDIVAVGSKTPGWTKALAADAPVWAGMSARASAAVMLDGWRSPRIDSVSARRRLVIPLREPNIVACPRECWALIPSRRAVTTFADKRRFARFVDKQGLNALAPVHYRWGAAMHYPVVLKRTDLNSASGVALVHSAEDLLAYRKSEMWAGRPVVIQEAVPGRLDYVTHCVAVDGRIVWHCSYAFELEHDLVLRGPRVTDHPRPHLATRAELRQMERFLRPLRFSGPVNFDYKRGPGGIVVFEINPRLGGSLFREQNVGDLRACLIAIARHAQWRPRLRRSSVVIGSAPDPAVTLGESHA
jgi:hypothetical protein